MAKKKQATDYSPDPHNANRGTQRGSYMVDHSITEYGLGRSIVVDKEGRVIAGNKTLQAAIDAGLIDVQEVETDGTTLVVVKRTDLDLLSDEDRRGRLLAYADNRASEVGLEWDAQQVLADVESGIDLSGMFRDEELEGILGTLEPVDRDDFSDSNTDRFEILITLSSEASQTKLLAELIERGIECRALIS